MSKPTSPAPPPPKHPQDATPEKRAWAQLRLALIGAIQSSIGIAIFVWSGVFVEWMVNLAAAQGLTEGDQVAVSVVQLISAGGFVLMGSLNICTGVIHATRATWADIKGE